MSFAALSVLSALITAAPDAPVRRSANGALEVATPLARRTPQPVPRIAEPQVAVPLIVGGGAAALSVYFFSLSARDFDRSRNAPLPSLDSARPLLESGARNQWLGTGTAALSALSLGTAAWFFFRPASDPGASTVMIFAGPGSLAIAGSWQ